MDKKNESIAWSDNWWLEGQHGWFIPGKNNILLMANFDKKEISLVDVLPVKKRAGFRMYPRCIKTGQYIFCLPTYEKDIFRYNCKNKSWKKISLACGYEKRVVIIDFAIFENKLYIVSKGLSKIIIINIEEGIVTDEYKIGGKDEIIGRSVFAKDYIYISSSVFPLIYEFNIHTNKIKKLRINGLNDSINTLCLNEDVFWISGKKRAIYAWEKKNDRLIKYEDFPQKFGEYNFFGVYDNLLNIEPEKYRYPIFLESVNVGEFIWFIPFRTNKILYVSKKDYHIKEFVIDERINNQSELKEHLMLAMYLLLYIREERYIGIYSLKNEVILEIDSKQMNYEILNFDLNKDVMKLFLDMPLMENRKFDLRIFNSLLGEQLRNTHDNAIIPIYQMIKDK